MENAIEPKRSRRLLRLSVRALMLLVLVLAVALGWVVHRARVQRDAVAAIEKADGRVTYDWQLLPNGRPNPKGEPPWPRWMVERLGVDHFGNVVIASLGKKPDDALLAQAGRLPKLRSLGIQPANEITDAGVAHLAGLVNLENLNLQRSKVTGSSMAILRGMSRLKNLDLSGLAITDGDLVHLERLTNLEVLVLSDTRIGDEGLSHLEGLSKLQTLRLASTQITGPGLVHLGKLTGLRRLFLERSKVKDLSKLPTMPGLMWLILDETQVDDTQVDSITRFTALKQVGLARTGVTDAGVAKLQALKGSLVGLTLSGTKITDASAPTLALFDQMANLSLDDTNVTDATLDQLASLTKLNVINLANTAITDAGFARLRKVVPGMKTENEFYAAQRARNAASRPPAKPSSRP